MTSWTPTEVNAYCDEGVEIIDMDELKDAIFDSGEHDVEEVLEQIVAETELSMWDLPSIKEMNQTKSFYFPVTRVLGNVSVVVGGNKTKMKDIKKLCDYYNKYNVKIKGILIDPVKKDKNK